MDRLRKGSSLTVGAPTVPKLNALLVDVAIDLLLDAFAPLNAFLLCFCRGIRAV